MPDSSGSDPLSSSWDVIVIGGGAAGLMACLELPASLSVLLLNKSGGPRSSSRWAQGGIAAVTRPEDSFESHRRDTLRAGADLCDPAAVDLLVREAPACVRRLLELGMAFDRSDGALSTTLEAAHSHRRVLHVQDRTGRALVQALEDRVRQRASLVRRDGVRALRLQTDGGVCRGVLVLEGDTLRWLAARAVVLATGGAAHLFANSTNPPSSCGDGIAMAWQAGAMVCDLEFVQFHPTALMVPGAPHFLISEAVRGEGGRLLDASGRSPVSHLSGGDLAPRDQVSRALVQAIQASGASAMGLDMRPMGIGRMEGRFPTILRRCRQFGVDPTLGPIPVAPAAHYWMGGVRTDRRSATSLPGLHAVGEVACTGVHGANRLASNSLMECLVYARQLRRIALPAPVPSAGTGALPSPRRVRFQAAEIDAPQHCRARIEALRTLCWRVAGVERNGTVLGSALRELAQEERHWLDRPLMRLCDGLESGDGVRLGPEAASALAATADLCHRLTVTRLLVEAALFRGESRGGHHRIDAPRRQPFWRRHTVQRRGHAIATAATDALAGPRADRLRGGGTAQQPSQKSSGPW